MVSRTAALVAWGVLTASAAAAQNCTNDARQVVSAIYRQVMERNAQANELSNWANRLSGGQVTVREIVQDFAVSAEHRQRFLAGTSDGDRKNAVSNLYKHLLGREPDGGGLHAHMDLAARRGIDVVVSSLISSTEYQQKYGEQTVPGQTVRYCGALYNSSANNDWFRFRRMDRNNNGVIERNEWTGSAQSFNVHDWNRDGVLSNSEVRIGAQRWPNDEEDFDPNGPATWTPQAFRQIDRNHDGRIVPNEWYYGPESFRRADRDRNGALSDQEFVNTGRWDDDRDDRFEYLDINNNGRIERREWHGSDEAFQWLDRDHDNVLSRAEMVGDGSTRFDSFATLDANGDGRLDQREWRWSIASFNRYDTNNDRVLTRQEFARGGGAPSSR